MKIDNRRQEKEKKTMSDSLLFDSCKNNISAYFEWDSTRWMIRKIDIIFALAATFYVLFKFRMKLYAFSEHVFSLIGIPIYTDTPKYMNQKEKILDMSNSS